MTNETKAKWQRRLGKAKRFLKDYGLPIFAGATAGAAWSGHKRAIKLERQLAHTNNVVDHNADVQRADRERLLDLERRQAFLFEKALRETEGKTE